MASLASLRPPWRSPKAIHVIWRIALFRACAEEIRGSSSNPATFKDAKMSSSVFLEGAVTTADKAVDGDTGGHLYFSAGCAITDWQAEPWWRVDLGTLIPMAVVRIYPRTDNPTFTKTGLQMRVGMKDQWDGNPACASDIALQTVGVTAVNCFAGGRFVFIGAPNTESARLAICEIDVVIRGPKEVKQYMGAIGRPVDIRVDGVGMLPEDRIRIIKPSILCGSATADSMDSALVERTRPYGAPEVESSEVERWLDVEFLKMGFYKICWCSGMFSCVNGADFTFLIGFAVITGEMRTVAGNGTEPVRNVDEWEDLYTVRVGSVNGMALSADGLTLYWAEPHWVREANLVNGSVRTLVGDLQAGNCVAPGFVCGDGLPGTSARLNDPRGLAVCRGELLIADHMNSRIRAYNFETGIITTKVGTDHGYSGDGGAPNLAKLSGPTGVVCDDLRGYWIADTGNSAIRGVRVSPGQSDVISTVVGGLGQGLATPGTWSNQAQLDHPMQLAMSERWGAPRSLTYVENYNAVARFLPLGSSVMEGAVQQVIGTGSTGHTTTANKQNIMMNRPEGIAVHSSTVFVSDTMNHRIIMVPILEYEPLGCYKEVTIEGESTLIPSLEGDLEAGLVPAQVCRDEVLDVADAVARCARATIRKGWEVFAVRCGGVCASAIDADNWYRFNGWSTLCEKGRGGLTANSVYRIIKEHAKDLIGNFYIIAGQALTTETGEAAEKPRAGFFGDRLASWLTAMDEPSQMAASEITRNLFFGDRGNKRVRVIFGSLGPQPQTQQFYCTNGLECVLNVNGNGFSEKDHIAFSRDYFTSAVVCGQDRLEDQFPQVHNLAEWSRLFLNKNFNLGRISLPAVGQFIVCYCIGNVGKECDVTQDFEFKAGRLHVVGPNARSTFYALAGVPFDLALFGSAFRTTDRIRLIRLNETCGAGGSTSVDDMLPFIRVAGNASLKAGIGPWDEGSETYQVWLDLSIDEAAELKVCWCNEAPCPFDSFFQVEAMYLSVRGPEQKSQVVEYGQPFDLLMEGPGGFKAADRVRLQDATVPCNAPQRRADLEDALPLDATPCEVSATSVRWCGVKLPLSAPSSLVACWCGALGGFNATNYTGVPAVWLSVNGQGQGAAGPVYRRELPPPPLSDSGWPSYINKGAYNISVQMYGRNAPGAASPGPLHVTICEMPDRCLLPLELRELSAGGAVTAEAERTWSGTTLFPKAVKVTSLSADPYLADFVDVELSGQRRRFPLNRWLLTQDGYTENVWESFTPPPLPTAAPTETLYTEGDRCGGCGLGMICRERPQTALELAKQGISLATATTVYMVWDCQFACGDGLVIGEEECDDGGLDAFDGCDANCKVEPGFVCSGATGTAPSQCRPVGCGALPHPSPVAACEDAESSPAAVTCRSNDELGACGSLSPPSLFAACPGQATQRCEATISRPQAVLAQLVHGGSALMLAFDTTLAELDGLSYGTELNCSNVFSPTTVAELGDEALCLQGSPRHIVVRLGFGASLGTASTAVFVLDAARQYQQIDVPIEVSRPFEFPSQRLFLGPALGETWNFQQPQVVLRGPSIWGQCGDLHLDGSFSLGSGGRPWKLIRWRCSGDGSHCAKIISYLPNSCNQLTLGLDTAGLAVGSVPCGLRATIPESVAIELTMALANLNVYLKLENVLGQWDEAMHGISFTTSRVPDAVALTSRQVLVDQGSSIRLELSVGPALPVASLGAGSSCGALGPVSLEWRYGAGTVADASQAWSEMSSTPASLIATLDAKTALLEGFLGSMDVPGNNWTLVARVFHTAGGESVYVPFFLAVRPQPPSISLDAPMQISDQCSFSVVASSSGVSGDPYITWRCVLMDVVAANNQEASLCAARALQERGSVLSLPALIPGVYQIEAILDDPLKPMDTIFVHVATGAGPRVQILEPALPLRRSGGDDVRFKARLLATSCGTSAMAAAVVVFSSVPGEGAEDPSARPELVLSTTVMNISQDVQPDDNFEAVIPLASLALGLSHSFHLLLAEGIQARQAMQQYTSNLSPLVPSSMEVPAEVWAYRSAPVTRCLLPAAELFVEPATGFSSRTLFTLRARALCEGCMYSFRLATRSMVDPNATDSPTDCSRATTTWQDLRTWSSDPEAKLPLLQGNYVLEVRVRSLDGGTSQACNMVDVTDSNLDPTFQGVTPEQADALIKTWTSDASRSIATLRALQQPTLLVQSLDSISKEFPRTETLAPSTADSSGQAMRQLYSEFCEGATDAVDGLPASEFLSSRRLSQGTPMLTSAMQSLLACMDGLFPLLTLPELWQTLQVLDAVLDRNAQLRGILGPGSSGRPLVSLPLLALCDLVLLKAYHIANSTSVITRSNTTALVDRIMATTLGIGNVAASTSTFDAAPIQVFNPGRALVLSTKSFQSYTLRTSGLTLDHTTQTFQDLPYPGLSVPAIPDAPYSELTQNVTTLSGPPLCLGDATLMGRLDLLIIQWGFNTIAVGQRVGSTAPADGVLISMRDIRLRSCGVDVPLFPAALESQEVEMLVELPEDVIQERRWGYGNISPFRCVRWVSSGFGRPGQWIADGCSNAYRGQDDPPVGDKAGLAEGVLRCRCTSLIPGTWAVEIVPRPPVIVEPPEVLNTSVKTLVAYAALIMWLPLLVPLLVWALMGDLILSLHGEEATKKLAEGLLPAALISGGVWGDAEKLLQNSPWPLRCSFSLHLVAFVIFLRSLCGAGRRQRWRDEAKDVSRYRNALCYARLKGSRVEPEAPLRAAEPQAAQASLPAQDPTIRERAPVAKWRKGPAALPASDQPAAAVKVPVAETQEQPKLLSHQPDPIGALLKQPDAFEEQQAKQAALHMTEYDWSEQVRGNVTSTGVQRSVLPEGWIMQNAGSQVYYVNLLDGKSTWERPTQPAMNVLSMQELRDLLGRAADGIALRKQLEEMLRPRIAERLAAMGDVAAQGQDRRFHHEAMHRAPAPEEENVAPPDSLRQAALVETSTGEFQASMSGVEGSLRLPLRFRALAWGFCTLLGACFLRSWPVTAALLPCLRPSRLERATKFAYRLNAALAFAAGALYLQPIADFSSIPEAVNADRPDAELWAELEITQPLAIALGCASVVVGRFLAALLPVFPAVKAKELDNFGARSNWWKRAWIKQRTTEGFALFLGIGAAFLAVLLSAVQPQPRGAVAMASFCWAALMELVILPILSSLMQALSIYCVARDCCCGPSTAFLARLPGLLRFPPKGSWTSRDVLFKHLEALNSETSPRHQTKR